MARTYVNTGEHVPAEYTPETLWPHCFTFVYSEHAGGTVLRIRKCLHFHPPLDTTHTRREVKGTAWPNVATHSQRMTPYLPLMRKHDEMNILTRFLDSERDHGSGISGGHQRPTPNGILRVPSVQLSNPQQDNTTGLETGTTFRSALHMQDYLDFAHPS